MDIGERAARQFANHSDKVSVDQVHRGYHSALVPRVLAYPKPPKIEATKCLGY
jgi:hypothetical protein